MFQFLFNNVIAATILRFFKLPVLLVPFILPIVEMLSSLFIRFASYIIVALVIYLVYLRFVTGQEITLDLLLQKLSLVSQFLMPTSR